MNSQSDVTSRAKDNGVVVSSPTCLMAAAAATTTSPSSLTSSAIWPSHSTRRGKRRRVKPPPYVAAAKSSSSRRTLSLQLRLPLSSRFYSFMSFARRGKNTSAAVRSGSSKKETKSLYADDAEEEVLDEDALEALFSQLDEDVKHDNLSNEDIDDEITEDDLPGLEEVWQMHLVMRMMMMILLESIMIQRM